MTAAVGGGSRTPFFVLEDTSSTIASCHIASPRFNHSSIFYALTCSLTNNNLAHARALATVALFVNTVVLASSTHAPLDVNSRHTLEVIAHGHTLKARIDGKTVIDVKDDAFPPDTSRGAAIYVSGTSLTSQASSERRRQCLCQLDIVVARTLRLTHDSLAGALSAKITELLVVDQSGESQLATWSSEGTNDR